MWHELWFKMLLPVIWICLFILLDCPVSWCSCSFNWSKILPIWEGVFTSLSASCDWHSKNCWTSIGNASSGSNLKTGQYLFPFILLSKIYIMKSSLLEVFWRKKLFWKGFKIPRKICEKYFLKGGVRFWLFWRSSTFFFFICL